MDSNRIHIIAPPITIGCSSEVELRELKKEDADTLFVLTATNSLYLREWLPWVDRVTHVSDSEDFIKEILAHLVTDFSNISLGIFYKDKLVGVIGWHKVDLKKASTSLGYWLDEYHQGKGIVTAAVNGLVNWLFSVLDLARVEIHCAVNNSKSQAIPKRLGFSFEKVVSRAEKLYGHYVDHQIWYTTKETWRKNQTEVKDAGFAEVEEA